MQRCKMCMSVYLQYFHALKIFACYKVSYLLSSLEQAMPFFHLHHWHWNSLVKINIKEKHIHVDIS